MNLIVLFLVLALVPNFLNITVDINVFREGGSNSPSTLSIWFSGKGHGSVPACQSTHLFVLYKGKACCLSHQDGYVCRTWQVPAKAKPHSLSSAPFSSVPLTVTEPLVTSHISGPINLCSVPTSSPAVCCAPCLWTLWRHYSPALHLFLWGTSFHRKEEKEAVLCALPPGCQGMDACAWNLTKSLLKKDSR